MLRTAFATTVVAAAASAAPPEGMRWIDHAGLSGSKNPSSISRPAATDAPVFPLRSTLQVVPLTARTPNATALIPVICPTPQNLGEPAYIMAHLLPGADMFLQGVQVISDAQHPVYELPIGPLDRFASYSYTVMVRWVEDGKWVTQSHSFTLKSGEVHCVQIALNDAPGFDKKIRENLARLSETDRQAAATQEFCAVQSSIKLGAMGTPVKVALGGKDVFLCCEACKAAALKDAGKTLKTIEDLKARKSADKNKK
jgi:hypothetical protein